MKRIRWGVLSTGRIAQQFAQDMAFVDNSEIVAASSRSLDNATAFANKFGVPTVHARFDDMLADERVDAIYVATPHSLHRENTLAAIAAAKPVLCEKPITLNPDELHSIIDAARSANVYVMEAMWTWFLPAIRTAKRWVDAGRIGPVVQVKVDFGYPQRPYSPDRREYDAALGGGALLEMGIYPVALLWLFLERAPLTIDVVAKHAPNGVEDDLSAVLDYGDCIGTIGTSFRSKMQNWAYVIGEDGYIAIPDFWRASQCHLYELDTCRDSFEDGRQSIGLEFETRAVAEDLLAGRTESATVSLDDSLHIQNTLQSIRQRFSH
ncbi:MAG: Gfo/Idh/MocA family oxidoreductase [Pseudomonadota bacterium]